MAAAVQYPFSDLEQMKLWDVAEHTSTPQATMDFCQTYGLISSTPTCGHCRIPMPFKPTYKGAEEAFRFRCSKKACRAEIPVRRDSFFHDSKIPMSSVIRFEYAWA